MEKRPLPIGEILAGLGLITHADVERALAHQRQRGGYFGEALVELGLLTQEQVKFGLADQYDLPFVHLRAESIDHSVARLVPPEWSREHLILPVLQDRDTVTVILTTPPTEEELDQVRRFTRAERIEAAVSTAAMIRELIETVYGVGGGEVRLGEWINLAMAAEASEIGVSLRGDRALAWYRATEARVRSLARDWLAELRRLVSPLPDLTSDSVVSWPAILSSGERRWRVACSAVRAADGSEWVARIESELPPAIERPAVTDELRSAFVTAAERGPVSLSLRSTDEIPARAVLEAVLPGLPQTLRAAPRCAHLADHPVAVPPDALLLRVQPPLAPLLAELEAFAFDALTLDVEALDPRDLEAASRVAPLVVFRCPPHLEGRITASVLSRIVLDGDTPLWSIDHVSDGTG